MKKLVHLECGHTVEISKPQAKKMKAEQHKSMGCPQHGGEFSRILSIRVPKES